MTKKWKQISKRRVIKAKKANSVTIRIKMSRIQMGRIIFKRTKIRKERHKKATGVGP